METFIIAIDAIIATKPVRWLLLVITCLLLVVSGFSLIRQKALALQLQAANGAKAQYAERLLAQNSAIIKAGQEYQQQQKKVSEATQKAAQLADQLKKRRAEIREVVLQGDCPQMVQQVLNEVRK